MAGTRKPPGGDDAAPGCPLWMVSFSDIMTLLLTFFVMLMSFRDFGETDAVKKGEREPSGGAIGTAKPVVPADAGREAIESTLEKNLSHPQIEITRTLTGTRLVVQSDFLFQPGSADVSAGGQAFLARLAALVLGYGNRILIEGHADLSEAKAPGGARLAVDRAFRAAEAVRARGAGLRVGVADYGTQRPLDRRDTATARARNRRVEIVVLPAGR